VVFQTGYGGPARKAGINPRGNSAACRRRRADVGRGLLRQGAVVPTIGMCMVRQHGGWSGLTVLDASREFWCQDGCGLGWRLAARGIHDPSSAGLRDEAQIWSGMPGPRRAGSHAVHERIHASIPVGHKVRVDETSAGRPGALTSNRYCHGFAVHQGSWSQIWPGVHGAFG